MIFLYVSTQAHLATSLQRCAIEFKRDYFAVFMRYFKLWHITAEPLVRLAQNLVQRPSWHSSVRVQIFAPIPLSIAELETFFCEFTYYFTPARIYLQTKQTLVGHSVLPPRINVAHIFANKTKLSGSRSAPTTDYSSPTPSCVILNVLLRFLLRLCYSCVI